MSLLQLPGSSGPMPAARALLVAVLTAACGGDRDGAESAARDTAPGPDYESMDFPYDLEPAQKRAVGRFLESREGWRLAVTSDNTNPLLGTMKRDDPSYRPYFLEGDLTGDGREDFALAVTNDGGAFRVVWFRNAGREYAPPQPVASAGWLDRGGLFLKDGDLLVGEFYTDHVQRYAWNEETHRLERQEVTGELRS